VSKLACCPTEQSTGEFRPTTVTVGHFVQRGSGDNEPQALRRNFYDPLSDTERNIRDLYRWPEGWNGYDAAKPNPASIAHAQAWITQLYRDVRAALWIEPHVIADADGDVVFEWWNGQKKLTVYVSPTTAEYVKVEGPDITSDMEDGVIETARDRRDLWQWLLDESHRSS
jgi:hypothetical protein